VADSTANGRTPEDVRRDIGRERDQLASAVEELREGLGEVTDIAGKLRAKLPVVAAGALAGGFVLAGGIGATLRLFVRRGREGNEQAKVGPFSLVRKH
jgi:hypothetical protein